tara:strand:- start:161 stop:304 length:144 start_codon:yes stop_codon:yes gene_type:complete
MTLPKTKRLVRIFGGCAMLPMSVIMLLNGHGEAAAIWGVVGCYLIFI